MKQTSINKLSEVYNTLVRADLNVLADIIQEVLRAEAITPAKGKKFNLYNYVSNDNLREQMCCVYHDAGYKVASDLHVLVAIKDEYSEEFEGKLLKKDGSFLENRRYPNWKGIIPNVEKGDYEQYQIDTQKFYEWLDAKRAEEKAQRGKSSKFSPLWVVKFGEDIYLDAKHFALALDAATELGTEGLWIKDKHSSVMFKSDNGFCLLQPNRRDKYENENICEL